MTHATGWLTAALLFGGLAACEPSDDALASWRARCAGPEDVARHVERSREGVSITCGAAALERQASR